MEQSEIERNISDLILFNYLFNQINTQIINFHLINENNDYLQEEGEFWEPVKVGLPENLLNEIKIIKIINDCNICTENKELFCKLECCNTDLCQDCVNNWFKISVYCPYCKKDIRELNLKN